jgi:hypothetical protein
VPLGQDDNSRGFTLFSGAVSYLHRSVHKKNPGPFGVTRISRPQLPGSGATFSTLRAFLPKWEILSQLAWISLRHCLNNLCDAA